MKQELKVGDVVKHWGFNFEPLRWWELLYMKPKWWTRDVMYFFRKQGQRIRDGFPSEESFDFHSHCAKWSLPRLKQMRNNLNGYPISFMEEADDLNTTNQLYFDFIKDVSVVKTGSQRWEEVLDKIIWSMENHDNEPDPIYPENYDHRQLVVSADEHSIGYKPADERRIDWTPCEEHNKRVQEGFDLFGRYFLTLWD